MRDVMYKSKEALHYSIRQAVCLLPKVWCSNMEVKIANKYMTTQIYIYQMHLV